MIDRRASRRYARALFDLAVKENELDKIAAGLLEVSTLIHKHPEIMRLVSNSTVGQSEKEDFLDKIIPTGIPAQVLQFLKVLAKKKRFREFSEVQQIFHKLYEEKQGVEEVKVISAVPLSESVQTKLTTTLEKKLNAKVRLIQETNTDIIGGLILRFQDNEIDASYRSRILEIEQILKR